VAVWLKMSHRGSNLVVQLPIVAVATVLTVLVLGTAGRWLGDDLPPLAAVSFAMVFLYFEVGLHSRNFAYVFAIAILGLGLLGLAVTQLWRALSTVVIWTLLLIGLGILAMLTSRAIERDLGVQVERQSSLLATLSDLGEGLVITENGRFVAGNDAYVNLTGYTREQLAALPSLIDLAPPEDRQHLSTNLTQRLAGGDVPGRYTSAIVTRSGARVEVDVAIHRLTTRRNQLLTLVSDISERRRAEAAERDTETRFRILFEQAQAGMAFTSLDGHITTVNPAFCEMVGYSEAELRTPLLLDITHPDDVAALQDAMRTMLAGQGRGPPHREALHAEERRVRVFGCHEAPCPQL
jgi:PAS domain S-box-containing protein